MDQLYLMNPSEDFVQEIADYRQEFIARGDSMDGTASLYRLPDPYDWLEQVKDLSAPETTPEGWVPCSQYICVRAHDKRIVGMIQVRHVFNEYLEKYGGHIGYSVRPSERGKGYAKWMLRSVLPYCRELGLKKLLITCDEDNSASARVIVDNGGEYESTVLEPDDQIRLERYWIFL